MSLSKLLDTAGLSKYQISLFTTLIKNPDKNAKELSKVANVPLGRIYTELEALEKMQLIDFSTKRPKRYFIQAPRQKILRLIENEKNKFEDIENTALDEFVSINKKSAEIFHTNREIKQSQIDCFRWANEEICQCLGSLHKASTSKDLKSIYEDEIHNSLKKGVSIKALYKKGENPPNAINQLQKEFPDLLEIRFSKQRLPRFEIIDKNQILLKIQDPTETVNTLGTVIINNISLAKKLRQKFINMWDESEAV